MKVLGIDPGYGRMGVAIVEKEGKERLLYSDCLITEKSEDFSQRLSTMEKALEKVIKEWQPDTAAMEKLFLTKNHKTAMRVAEARGMVLALLARLNINCREYTPGEVKVAVAGHGAASKEDVGRMIKLLVPHNKVIPYDDENDAIALALTHIASARVLIHRKT